MKIMPTIGRKVWFWKQTPAEGVQPEDATVVYVHGESLVNLYVIDHGGTARAETSVSLRQPEDPEWTGKFCEWMPYQAKQAAKDAASS